MKKFVYLIVALIALGFVSCKEDDTLVTNNAVVAGGVSIKANETTAAQNHLQSSITDNGASVIGTIVHEREGMTIEEYGLYYSKTPDFSIGQAEKKISTNLGSLNGFGANDFSVDLSDLVDDQVYYYRFYVKHSGGYSYSELDQRFTLQTVKRFGVPLLEIATVDVMYLNEEILYATITHTGNYSISGYGVRYGSSASSLTNTVVGSDIAINGTKGSFKIDLRGEGFSLNQTVYFQLYAVNDAGEGVSETVALLIDRAREYPVLSVVSVVIDGISQATVTFKLDSKGFDDVKQYGYYLYDDKRVVGNMALADGDTFTVVITGLKSGQTYGVYPFAINGDGESLPMTFVEFYTGVYGKNDADKTILYAELDPIESSGKLYYFLDRNLGAPIKTQTGAVPAQRSDAGWLIQWGRDADGHQVHGSPNVTIAGGTTVFPVAAAHKGRFIANGTNWVWINKNSCPEYVGFWTSADDGGTNNPCPTGYRVPTRAEIALLTHTSTRPNMFLPEAKYFRAASAGHIATSNGLYWTCEVDPNNAKVAAYQATIGTGTSYAVSLNSSSGQGNFVRCVRVVTK